MTTEVEFEGVCHPPGEAEDYDGLYLTKSELEKEILTLPGKPVRYEHEKKIGEVLKACINDEGKLQVTCKVDRTKWDGVEAVHGLRNGYSLSPGTNNIVGANVDKMDTKILGKEITEVSVVKNPDKYYYDPDLVCYDVKKVQPDSENWNVSRTFIRESHKNDKLKRNLHITQQKFKDVDPSGSILTWLQNFENPAIATRNMSGTAGAPALEEENLPAQEESDEMEENSVEKLKEELDKLQSMNDALKQKQEQYADVYDQIQKDPVKVQQMLLTLKEQEKMLQGEMKSKSKMLEDFMVASFENDQKKVPESLLHAVRTGHENPDTYKPLYQLVTVSHNNAVSSKAKREGEYRKLKEKNEANKRKYAELEKRIQTENKTATLRQKMDPRSKAKPTQQSSSQPPKKQKTAASSAKNAPPPPNIPQKVWHPGAGVGFQGDCEEEHKSLLEDLFGSGAQRLPTGMERVNYDGITGKDYGTPGEGIDHDTRELFDGTYTFKANQPGKYF